MKIEELRINSIPPNILDSIPLDKGMRGAELDNPNIGPHEGREMNLMLTGKKFLALLSPDKFRRHQEIISTNNMIYKKVTGDRYFVALPGYERELNYAVKLWNDKITKRIGDTRYHISLGKLLGYTNQQIKAFLERIKSK